MEFPHEMGIFLGYPLGDVKGFIRHRGRDFLYCGYWKVYENEAEARKLFSVYTSVKQQMLKELYQGKTCMANDTESCRNSSISLRKIRRNQIMNQVVVTYWSGSGNTQEMAELIGQGVRDAGQSVSVIPVDEMKAADLKEYQVFALGCPSMGAEELEETIMEPFCRGSRKICGRQKNSTVWFLRMGRWRMDAQLGNTDGECRSIGIRRRKCNLCGGAG